MTGTGIKPLLLEGKFCLITGASRGIGQVQPARSCRTPGS